MFLINSLNQISTDDSRKQRRSSLRSWMEKTITNETKHNGEKNTSLSVKNEKIRSMKIRAQLDCKWGAAIKAPRGEKQCKYIIKETDHKYRKRKKHIG